MLIRWIALVIAIFVAAHIPFLGITFSGWETLFVAALILSVLNVFVRPVLLLFSLPLIVVTLGLFIWVINALLLYFVSYLMGDGFVVPSFWSALGGALIISLVSLLIPSGQKKRGVQVRMYRSGGTRGDGLSDRDDNRRPPPGSGPVIDI